MSMMSEFKEFAMKGSVVDLAVGIIIGGAFGKIVSSFVDNVLMPPIGKLLGGVDFTDLKLPLGGVDADGKAVNLEYGIFIQSVVDFVIIAFAIFMMIRLMNNLKRKEEEAPEEPSEPSEEAKLLAEIRDSLKARP